MLAPVMRKRGMRSMASMARLRAEAVRATVSALRGGHVMIGGRALLRGELQLRPHDLASEVRRDTALRDGYRHFSERTGHRKIPLARGPVEPPGAPENFEGSRTTFTRFAGARPAPIGVRAILREKETTAFSFGRLGGRVHVY